MEWFASLIGLPVPEALFLVAAVLLAGVVRGFAGFGLTAVVVASSATILTPKELIPVCWMLEATATALIVRGGLKEADKKVGIGLTMGSIVGMPIGLALTLALPADGSKLTALSLVLVLALVQMANVRIAILATNTGLYGSGVLGGIAYGLAGLGGMAVSLYVLASGRPAPAMRGSMILYMVFSALTAPFMLVFFGLLTEQSLIRGAALMIPAAMGALLGARFFTPESAKYYRPFCLTLLIVLSSAGIIRLLA